MQQHAEEQRAYHGDGCQCPDQTPRYPVANEGEEGQKQEEGPVHLHVYTCHSSYRESTTHTVRHPNREAYRFRKIGGVILLRLDEPSNPAVRTAWLLRLHSRRRRTTMLLVCIHIS